jgi:acyl-CoA thioester hydrolase
MSKPFDPALLELSRYPYQVEIGTRFADMDINGHINNVALSAAFEDARARFDFDYCSHPSRDRVMTVSTYIDFMAQAHYPRPLLMAVGVLSVGASSWSLSGIGMQGGVACALCRVTMVNTDGSRPKPIAEEMRVMLTKLQLRDA